MQLRLYDTKTKQVRPLETVRPDHVGIYLCGPTVQGAPHIGHLRASVCFDVLIRWLRANGQQVTYVRNITDIDDKILTKAKTEDMPWWALAAKYEREFAKAYDQLGLLPPTYEPRATGHIIDQIALVQSLLDTGHAYSDNAGNVYFDVSSQPDYGSLTHQKLADMRTTEDDGDVDASRESGKRDPRDFALWKAPKPGEPESASWETPWGRGRPGWHLECSAMAQRYLGDEFDIHGGGIDLRFPHHENEQAQSHAAGWDFVRIWMHNAWVTMASEKMSKSLGNTLSLENLTRKWPAAVVRFALSTVHYRSTIEWSDETLERAGQAWDKFVAFVSDVPLVEEPVLEVAEFPHAFTAAMNDDLNVAGAMATVYEHLKKGRRALADHDEESAQEQCRLVRGMLGVLGLDPGAEPWSSQGVDVPAERQALDSLVKEMMATRERARAEKDWTTADTMRDNLTQAGIVVEDGADGSTWRLA